jgi:hypothetical protein
MEDVGIFKCHLVNFKAIWSYFVAIWYISRLSGIFSPVLPHDFSFIKQRFATRFNLHQRFSCSFTNLCYSMHAIKNPLDVHQGSML